jgi:hypothetical protein
LIWVGPNLRLNIGVDLANKTSVAHVRTTGPDGNNVIDIDDFDASARAQCDIAVADGIVS